MRKRTPKIITFFFVALFLFSLVFSFALAEDRKLEIEYPEIFGLKPETVKTFLPEYAKYIFNFSIAIFGLVVFGVLIKGGALYMTSVGNPAKMQDAKEQIFSAFLGLVILLLSYIILTTINPQLVMFKVPLLTKPEICKTEGDCPGGFECKEGLCVMKKCETDAGCPTGFSCDEETKVCVFKQKITLISVEIPLGQMIENGIWKKEQREATIALLDDFEKFLKEEIVVDSQKSNRISDLNKYLRNLTESCRCNNLIALATKPADWGSKVGCTGDPCIDKRDEIKKILAINDEKIKKLEEKDIGYKDKISQQHASSTAEGEKFLRAHETMMECLKRGDLLTLNDYLSLVEFYTEMGWKTILIPGYLPSQADPLTFYCSFGGTMFDMPQTPATGIPDTFDESISIPGSETEIEVYEPLSCLGEIPVGEILDEAVLLAYQSNNYLGLLTPYINELTKELRNMDKLISQCNEQNCESKSMCWENKCFMGVCGCIPVCPGDPPFPNRCWPNPFGITPTCLLPCLNNAGGCVSKNLDAPYRGSACPRDDIEASLKKIQIYEEDMFKIIADIKEFSYSAEDILKDEDRPIILSDLRAMASFCSSKDIEEPTWMMLNCEMALGNTGPDEKEITNCYPQSFFCCTSDKKELAKAKATLPASASRRDPAYDLSPTTDPVPPSRYGKSKVPYFSQSDPQWKPFNPIGIGCGQTISAIGCRLTSIAMVLKYYGVNTNPGILNKWAKEKSPPPGFTSCKAGGRGCCTAGIGVYANANGLKLARTFRNNEKSQLVKWLQENPGYPIIAGGGADAPYSASGRQHWIVLTAADEDYVYVNDPVFSRKGRLCKGICKYPIAIFKAGRMERAELLIPK